MTTSKPTATATATAAATGRAPATDRERTVRTAGPASFIGATVEW